MDRIDEVVAAEDEKPRQRRHVSAPRQISGGCVDLASDTRCAGWAWLPSEPDRAIAVEILVDGEKVASVIADRPRDDLSAAGIGRGKHGFDVELSTFTIGRGVFELRVINVATGAELSGSPRQVRCPVKPFDRFAAGQNAIDSPLFDRFPQARPVSLATLLRCTEMAKQQGIPIFVHAPLIDWNTPLFQRPQQMAAALARAGALVIYCSPCSRYDIFDGSWQLETNLFVTDSFDPLASTLEGCWFDFYSTSGWPAEKMREIGGRNHVIYEYVDHIDPIISGEATSHLQATFEALSSAFVTLFVATSKELERELLGRFGRERVVLNPNGTEISHFRDALSQDTTVPIMEQISRNRTRPIIGYFGALAPWLDYKGILEIAELMPDCEFVYIGPVYDADIVLPQSENLHWIGMVPYGVLPSYGRYFNVAIIPFLPGRIAQTTSPLKLFEYFALERPVVVQTEMIECCAFSAVRSASNPSDYVTRIREALSSEHGEQDRLLLRQTAEANSWVTRATELIDLLRDPPVMLVRPQRVSQAVVTSILSGNLEVSRRMPTAIVRRSPGTILFHFDEDTIQRGDYVALGLAAGPHPVETRLMWHIAIGAVDNELMRARKPFAVQLLVNGEVLADDYLGARPTELEFGFISTSQCSVCLRLLALYDLPDPWGWGEAARVAVCRLDVAELLAGVEANSFVSSPGAHRFGQMRRPAR